MEPQGCGWGVNGTTREGVGGRMEPQGRGWGDEWNHKGGGRGEWNHKGGGGGTNGTTREGVGDEWNHKGGGRGEWNHKGGVGDKWNHKGRGGGPMENVCFHTIYELVRFVHMGFHKSSKEAG